MGGSIGLTAAIGGVILAIAIIYALLRTQGRTDADRRHTEEATRDLYARSDREDQVTDPDPERY